MLLSRLYGDIVLTTGEPRGGCQVKSMSETHRRDELPPWGSPRVIELPHKARPVLFSFPGRGSPRVVKSVWAHCFERPVDRVAVVG